MLQDAGFRVTLAATTDQALSRRPPPDLILAAVELPDSDGFALCRKLKSIPDTRHLPVILVSVCFTTPEEILRGLDSGADDCLVPTVSELELITRIKARLRVQDAHVRRTNHLLSQVNGIYRAKLNRLRAALEIAQLGVWELTVQQASWENYEGAALIRFDERCCQIFGVPKKDYLTRAEFFALIHPGDRKRFQTKLHDALFQHGEGVFDVACRIVRSDGTQRWVVMRGHALPPASENDPLSSLTGTLWDVTEREQTQQALLRTEKLALGGRMAATIAHEINNPLAAVTNLLYITRTLNNVPASARQYLDLADAELKRIAHITRQSLGFYHELSTPAPTLINGVIDSAIDMLQTKIKAKHVKIEKQYEIAAQICVVSGELRQVFANFLANSLDAIDEQGTIKVRVSNHATSYNGNNNVRVTIADDGKGIDAGIRAHIFEPFFTTKDAYGTGLGLWVSKRIIDKHQGSIRLHSSVNGARRGTTVSVLLPADAAKDQPLV